MAQRGGKHSDFGDLSFRRSEERLQYFFHFRNNKIYTLKWLTGQIHEKLFKQIFVDSIS